MVPFTERPEINGYIYYSDDNWHRSFRIEINESFFIFLYKMTKLYISRIEIIDNNNRVIDKTKISWDKTVTTALRLIKSFWDDKIYKTNKLLQTESFSIINFTKSQIKLAYYLIYYAECFIIAHEFGHAVTNLWPESIGPELLTSFSYLAKNRFIFGKKHPSKEMISGWGKEINSDLLGMQFCLKLRDDNIGRIMIFSSIGWTFIMMDMLEQYAEKVLKLEIISDTHPPSYVRYDFLRSIVTKSNPSYVFQLCDGFRKLSDCILAKIG